MTPKSKNHPWPGQMVPPGSPSLPPSTRTEDAESVGSGVAVEDQASQLLPPPPPLPEPKEEREVWSLDAKAEWVDEATVENQTRIKGAWKFDRQETRVFDLANTDDAKALNALQTQGLSKFTNVNLVVQDRQFCEATGNWKILTTVVWIKYKKLVKGEKKTL